MSFMNNEFIKMNVYNPNKKRKYNRRIEKNEDIEKERKMFVFIVLR